jgi:hypothetical protein
VPVAYSEPGSRFIVETDDGAQEAVVTQLPFMKNRAK